jgi:hypothetical protein
MAVDRNRLAAALAYRQAEEERRRRMMESVPVPGAELPTPVPSQNLRRDLENLSIGVGEGLTNQLEGVKGIVIDPVGAARGAYEGVKAVVRDPSIIADALRYTAQKVGSGPLGAGEVIGEMIGPRKTGPTIAELDVYHGTPHRFPATEANPLGEFDASKIGTGEGAQTFGHGIYLTQKPEIAEYYKNTIQANPQEFVDGEFFDDSNPNHLAAFYAAQHMRNNKGRFDPEEVAKFAERGIGEPHQQAAALLRQGKFGKYTEIEPGTVYKADLPDEMIDRMLDWDKPLSQQSDYVKKVFGYTEPELPKNLKAAETGQQNPAWKYSVEGFPAAPTKEKAIANALESMRSSQRFVGERGEKLYRQIAERFISAKNPLAYQEASEELRRMGIPGIKYLDAGSRGQGGSGTRNFVVFPGEEKKVRILERK